MDDLLNKIELYEKLVQEFEAKARAGDNSLDLGWASAKIALADLYKQLLELSQSERKAA